MTPDSAPVYVFTDDGEKVLGTLTDWALRWKAKPGNGHRGMSYYLLSWDGDLSPFLHYIKITRRSGTVKITAHGVRGFVRIDETGASA